MRREATKQRLLLLSVAAALPLGILVWLFVHSQLPGRGVAAALLTVVAGGIGASLTHRRTVGNGTSADVAANQTGPAGSVESRSDRVASAHAGSQRGSEPKHSQTGPSAISGRAVRVAGAGAAGREAGPFSAAGADATGDPWAGVKRLLAELSAMQASEDLLERYHWFTGLIESCLRESLGECHVSLWCPDQGLTELIECVIRPTGEAVSPSMDREPCRVPLDSPAIRKALQTGRPYVAAQTDAEAAKGGDDGHGTLRCDACIALFRQYGMPLLINIERDRLYDSTASGTLEFEAAVNLIKMIWSQLQAVNQRQWVTEHEESSGVLRDEAFLTQSQTLAGKAHRQGELFSIVVITIRGFRSMFAGHSRQWRDISGVVARCVIESLREKGRPFLLGKMADDVFALLLSQADEFLAQAAMQAVMQSLDEKVPQDKRVDNIDTVALETQWALADQQHYTGDVQVMLDAIYRRLFCAEDGGGTGTHRIMLHEQAVAVQ